MEPNEILENVRQLIVEHSDGDPDKWWYANRFVFARLMLDERKTKSGVKKRLFAAKAACYPRNAYESSTPSREFWTGQLFSSRYIEDHSIIDY